MSNNLLDRICDVELGFDNLADYGFMHYNVCVYSDGVKVDYVVSVNKSLGRVSVISHKNGKVEIENEEVKIKFLYPSNLKMIDESTDTVIVEW